MLYQTQSAGPAVHHSPALLARCAGGNQRRSRHHPPLDSHCIQGAGGGVLGLPPKELLHSWHMQQLDWQTISTLAGKEAAAGFVKAIGIQGPRGDPIPTGPDI
jgi:hypothetical protein